MLPRARAMCGIPWQTSGKQKSNWAMNRLSPSKKVYAEPSSGINRTRHKEPAPENFCGRAIRPPSMTAQDWSRTSTRCYPHQALNLTRLPIPPPGLQSGEIVSSPSILASLFPTLPENSHKRKRQTPEKTNENLDRLFRKDNPLFRQNLLSQ